MIAAVFICADISAQENQNLIWDKANEAYSAGDYEAAATGYDSLVTLGYAGEKLFYNLGNAYFKSDRLGEAILFYNKAQRLAPSDEDIAYNLRIANGYVKDRIESVPEFFLATWIRSLRNSASSDTWAVISLLLFAGVLALAAVYLLGKRTAVRKTGFFGGIILLGLFMIAVSFSSIKRKEITAPKEAVILSSAAPVKSSPDNNSKDIFVLHEGTKVRVTDRLGEWREIMIADGNKGWVAAGTIGMID